MISYHVDINFKSNNNFYSIGSRYTAPSKAIILNEIQDGALSNWSSIQNPGSMIKLGNWNA